MANKMIAYRSKWWMLILLLSAVLMASPAVAQSADGGTKKSDEDPLDSVLDGFEDEAADAEDTDVDETDVDNILDGFDEEAAEEETDPMADDILDGFEDETVSEAETTAAVEQKSNPWRLTGHLKLAGSYNFSHSAPPQGQTDWRGMSQLESQLQLELRAKFGDHWQALVSGSAAYDGVYTIRGRDKYTAEVLKENEDEIELREAYIQGSVLQNLDLKLGRQIVVWGKSDNVRVSDLLNPLDIREPGMTDIEDLRLPVTMVRTDFYHGPWNLSLIALPEIRFNKMPPFGSDFFPGSTPPPSEEIPETSLDNTEWAAALHGVFSGWDLSLLAADVYDDSPHAEAIPGGGRGAVKLAHARLKMVGGAVNVAFGDWLLKAEAAYLDGFEYFNAPGRTFARIDAMAGFEYSGFTDATLSVEVVQRQILDYDKILRGAPDSTPAGEFQSVVRYTRNFLNETLELTLLASVFGPTAQDGAFERCSLAYDITDALKVSGGVVLYQSGGLPRLAHVADNDRLYLELKYSF